MKSREGASGIGSVGDIPCSVRSLVCRRGDRHVGEPTQGLCRKPRSPWVRSARTWPPRVPAPHPEVARGCRIPIWAMSNS